MFFITSTDTKLNVKALAISFDKEKADRHLVECAKDYIITEQGKKQADMAFDPKVTNGLVLVRSGDIIKLMRRTPGYVIGYTEEFVLQFAIIQFDGDAEFNIPKLPKKSYNRFGEVIADEVKACHSSIQEEIRNKFSTGALQLKASPRAVNVTDQVATFTKALKEVKLRPIVVNGRLDFVEDVIQELIDELEQSAVSTTSISASKSNSSLSSLSSIEMPPLESFEEDASEIDEDSDISIDSDLSDSDDISSDSDDSSSDDISLEASEASDSDDSSSGSDSDNSEITEEVSGISRAQIINAERYWKFGRSYGTNKIPTPPPMPDFSYKSSNGAYCV